MNLRNTYETAYRFGVTDVVFQSIADGKRSAIIMHATSWYERRLEEPLRRPPCWDDWVFLSNSGYCLPFRCHASLRDRLSVFINNPRVLELLGYASDDKGMKAFVTYWHWRNPDLPIEENPVVHLIVLQKLHEHERRQLWEKLWEKLLEQS